MEFMEHGDLQRYLTAPVAEQELQVIVSQILQGLKFMHEIGFAHRDLKPENIMVAMRAPNWWVKIADFGICKRTAAGGTHLRTQTGTIAFMAPEVCGLGDAGQGELEYTNAVDIWAIGVIAFRMLTAELLFPDLRSLARYVGGRLLFPIERLRALSISVSGCELIQQCTLHTPSYRPEARAALRHPWLCERPHRVIAFESGKHAENDSFRGSSTLDHRATAPIPSSGVLNPLRGPTASTAVFSATWASE